MFDNDIFLRQRFGGISRFFVEMTKHLPEQGIMPRILAPVHMNEYLHDLPAALFVGPRHRSRNRWVLAAARRMPQLTVRAAAAISRAQVVHETYYPRSASAPKGVPAVTTIHDMIHELDPSFAGDPVLKWKAAAIERANWITCPSEHTRQDLIRFYPGAEAKSSVIPLAAELPAASGAERPQARPYLLYVGERGRRYKNFRGLFDAFRRSPRLNAEFDLVCLGGLVFSDDERAMVVESGFEDRVRQYGTDDAGLAAWYAHAACLIYPSTYEGFGIPPLEAMAAGCPVIAMRRSSVPEVCGEAVLYAEAPDGEALATAIQKVVDDADLADRLKAAGRQRAAQFSWRRCAGLTAEVYRKVAA
jgi:glycosyltransferase involved in cell wall biosynthesis